eukprot:831415_1
MFERRFYRHFDHLAVPTVSERGRRWNSQRIIFLLQSYSFPRRDLLYQPLCVCYGQANVDWTLDDFTRNILTDFQRRLNELRIGQSDQIPRIFRENVHKMENIAESE